MRVINGYLYQRVCQYLLETDVPKALLDAKTVDERYRDLQNVERNFRTVKTTFLEIRPIFLRKAERTNSYVQIVVTTNYKPSWGAG